MGKEVDFVGVNNYLIEKGYSVEITGDGSPTLRWGVGESMHHSGGAASESVYIYRTALDFLSSVRDHQITQVTILSEEQLQASTLGCRGNMVIMSLGFGIGYNELLVADWILKNQFRGDQIKLYSYEKENFLYENFNLWLENKLSPLNPVFDLILDKIISADEALLLADKSDNSEQVKRKKNIKKILWELKQKKLWIQESALVPPFESLEKFNLFLFDAFSHKTTPELWDNSFLDALFRKNISTPCVFSTYACRGDLKRVLQKNNFQFLKRLGFKGKRDATLAFKI